MIKKIIPKKIKPIIKLLILDLRPNVTYKYKLTSEEWEMILQYLSPLNESSNNKALTILLKIIFLKLPDDYISKLEKMITMRRGKLVYEEIMQNQLIEDTIELDYKLLNYDQWINLYNLFGVNGMLILSFFARKKALSVSSEIKAYPFNNKLSRVRFLSLIEQNRLDEAYEVALDNNLFNSKNNDLKNLFFIYKGKFGSIKNISKLSNSRYSKLIKDKNIAVVGPAPYNKSRPLLGKEIDSFDLVIRFNYLGKELKDKSFGSKTDISYYNGNTINKINSMNNINFLSDLKFINFKPTLIRYQIDFNHNNKIRNLSNMKFMFNGYPNLLQIVLWDLLHFDPGRVKIFHNNLFHTNNAYRKGYEFDGSEYDISDKKNVFFQSCIRTGHDLISQFKFTKKLWEKDLVSVDEELFQVLSLTDYEYIEGLEKFHVKEKLTRNNYKT